MKLLTVALLAVLASVSTAQRTVKVPTTYNVLARSGDDKVKTKDGWVMGTFYDVNFKPIRFENNGSIAVSHTPDWTTLIKVGSKYYFVSQFEYPSPSGIWVGEMEQDKSSGKLSVKAIQAVDTKPIGGTINLCAGSLTTWNTHLGGEEDDPDARVWESYTTIANFSSNSAFVDMLAYFNLSSNPNKTSIEDFKKVFNPYRYGHQVEVAISESGNVTVKKWYTLGRRQNEMAYVMPDGRTVYMTDDGSNKFFSVFVMDRPNDLSSGTIFATVMTQISGKDGGEYDLKMIKLGSGNQTFLEGLLNNGLKFSQIFNATAFNKTGGTCPKDFRLVNAGYGVECLKLNQGQEVAAAFFETRRYAAYLGATTEMRKWEGITYDPDNMMMYTAISEVAGGMENNKNKGSPDVNADLGTNNDVKVEYNECGCVYKMAIKPERIASNSLIQALFPTRMTSIWCGTNKNGTDADNKCDVDNLASPDNIAYVRGLDHLLVSEDTTTGHQNDVLWLYDLNSGKRTRIMSTPYGSEVTSSQWYTYDGWAYMWVVIQHPYGESDLDKLGQAGNTGVGGYIGYIGPFKVSDLADAIDIDFDEVPVARGEERHKVLATSNLVITKPSSTSRRLLMSELAAWWNRA